MSLEALNAVREAEDEARQKKLFAHQKAREEIEEAERAGKAMVAATLARAKSEIEHLTRAADQKAMEQAKELASKTANRQATLRARAERRLDDAVKLIVERIVKV